MRIGSRYKQLSFRGSVAFILAVIFGIYFWLFPNPFELQNSKALSKSSTIQTSLKYRLNISKINVSTRGPVWNIDRLGTDEIVIKVSGSAKIPNSSSKESIVAFWRLDNDFETKWHVGCRRVGEHYRLATLDGLIARSGIWEFLVGGIECEKEYKGDILIVLLLYPQSIIDKNSDSWINHSFGWGFRKLPIGYTAISHMRVFNTSPVR